MPGQPFSKVYLALGSNLGDRLANLRQACLELSPQVDIERWSSVYETPPWGYADQPAFLNQVVTGQTKLTPEELLSLIKTLETRMGRVKNFQNGPRLIDIDILIYENLLYNTPDLILPHPRLQERAFVLVPLAEIEPDLVLPGGKLSVRECLAKVDPTGIHKVANGQSREAAL